MGVDHWPVPEIPCDRATVLLARRGRGRVRCCCSHRLRSSCPPDAHAAKSIAETVAQAKAAAARDSAWEIAKDNAGPGASTARAACHDAVRILCFLMVRLRAGSTGGRDRRGVSR